MVEAIKNVAQKEAQGERLEAGAYEVIRKRMDAKAELLRERQNALNSERKAVFGAIETKLEATEHLATSNNCTPRCIFAFGNKLILGYNVQLGLRSETTLADVFSLYHFEDGLFKEGDLGLLQDARFITDFQSLFKYYKNTIFTRFGQFGPHLFFKFRTGANVGDFKTFKWLIQGEALKYLDNRSDHEFRYPPQHEFEWVRTRREMHRSGIHPHISIEDRVFVECVGGDLTIKVEDNTASGAGIYAESVENEDQTLDDAEIYFASVGPVILLKIRPYQEQAFRYLVFNEKLAEVRRIDTIADACVLLPEDQGLIFSNGYYLLSGEYKLFEHEVRDVVFERRIAAPNGEDFLYAFYNRYDGIYVLLAYNLISQKVAPPIICHGYTLFEDGRLIYFRAEDEPRKMHALKIWRTPFVAPGFEVAASKDHPLYKIGNKAVVKVLAEVQEILNLVGKDDSFAGLFMDIVRRTTSLLDSIFWIRDQAAHGLGECLEQLRETAKAAIDEFEKVQQIRRATKVESERLEEKVRALNSAMLGGRFSMLSEFVERLAEMRTLRGELIGARELRYAPLEKLSELEATVSGHNQKLSAACVQFLLGESALAPYVEKTQALEKGIQNLDRVARAREQEDALVKLGAELELLTEIVSNLKIEDATQTTRIIDDLSTLYSELNRVKAALKTRKRELGRSEGVAEFNAQMKLLAQSVLNYLDICDVPEKCETYLTKTMVQIEEVEAKFTDFPEFIEQITAKREEIYSAFENRRLQLVETRNRRADAIASAAERILNGIRNRVAVFESVVEINSYFSGDLMVDKLRDLVRQLLELQDTVKAEDLESRLKTARDEALRQLKDRKELFAEGPGLIQLGRHKFTVNTQPLALTMIRRGDEMLFHLTGTNFFEPVVDPEFVRTQPFWEMEFPSENGAVYRAEYLAHQLLEAEQIKELPASLQAQDLLATGSTEANACDELLPPIQAFMASRYQEGYAKGVHDRDAARILAALIRFRQGLGLLAYPPQARVCARLYWDQVASAQERSLLERSAKTLGPLFELLPKVPTVRVHSDALAAKIGAWLAQDPLFPRELAADAALYLFRQLVSASAHPVSLEAGQLLEAFQQFTKPRNHWNGLRANLAQLEAQALDAFRVARDWAGAFIEDQAPERALFRDELAWLILQPDYDRHLASQLPSQLWLDGLKGDHKRIQNGRFLLDFHEFRQRLRHFCAEIVPQHEAYVAFKRRLTEQFRRQLRLEEFKPRVLSSFVRNQLIDRVYLPLIGDNLAKQIGAAGDSKRTDRMGMLLLLSPPGYGKTTLMEYVANRLGLIFMKINGPALGHGVSAIDPGSAPNASAREELEKLNLALEMGDNIMLYIDDIQHCNPEFLQKFISLCDAQRKIEGVYRGRTRTYDLRGKKVCVCMAGNPYTESGTRFQIPDMLANRADTYNLGDILSGHEDSFRLSYIENGLTSNPVLQRLANKSHKDVLTMVKIAQTGSNEGAVFEAEHSQSERNEAVSVLRMMLRARDVILAVNMAYIRSAAQEDAYRTEPAFKLQGSYRNMNKIAEKIHPILNEAELEQLIRGHYENEAQTLTAGAEANLLRFAALMGERSEKDEARWHEIVGAFRKRQSLFGVDAQDRMGQVVLQLGAFEQRLGGIHGALDQVAGSFAQAQHYLANKAKSASAPLNVLAKLDGRVLEPLAGSLEALTTRLEQALISLNQERGPAEGREVEPLLTSLSQLLSQQFEIMSAWLKPMAEQDQEQSEKIAQIQKAITAAYTTQRHIWQKVKLIKDQNLEQK